MSQDTDVTARRQGKIKNVPIKTEEKTAHRADGLIHVLFVVIG